MANTLKCNAMLSNGGTDEMLVVWDSNSEDRFQHAILEDCTAPDSSRMQTGQVVEQLELTEHSTLYGSRLRVSSTHDSWIGTV
jgi:hypothetical protein